MRSFSCMRGGLRGGSAQGYIESVAQQLKIAIVDADLIIRKKHRFPNLACMKLSAYYQDRRYFPDGNTVELVWSFEGWENYDHVIVSKVFTDTEIPGWLQTEFEAFKHDPHRNDRRIEFGGTGFYFDKAPDLPYEVEHHYPDYGLYLKWIEHKIEEEKGKGSKSFNERRFRSQFKEYTEYSIGFLTRGCFRKCPFCVNKKYGHVFRHSPISEFIDLKRKKICLLDDNFFGFVQDYDAGGINHSRKGAPPAWKTLLKELQDTGLPYKFKQGLDERLLSREMCQELFQSKYDGDFTFAFDKISDYDLIHQKLEIIRSTPMSRKASIRFYVLVGFTYGEDRALNANDIEDDFRRIELLMKYRCLPYIMRYQSPTDKPWKKSRFAKIYTEMARWCNQPNFFKKKSFREYCWACEEYYHEHGGREEHCSTWAAYCEIAKAYPRLEKYFALKYGEVKRLIGEPDFARMQRRKREASARRKRG